MTYNVFGGTLNSINLCELVVVISDAIITVIIIIFLFSCIVDVVFIVLLFGLFCMAVYNPYATSYKWLVLTYILYHTVSKLLQIIQICTVDRGMGGYLCLAHSFRVNPETWDHSVWPQESKHCFIVWCSYIDRWLFHFVTVFMSDRHTDGQTDLRQPERALT